MKSHLVTLLLIATLAGCQSTGAPDAHVASLNQEIPLAPGEHAAFSQQRLDLEFIRVIEDSRCPSDANCVWAGEVKLQVATRLNAAAAEQHEITSARPATVGAFRIVVVQVQPEKISTREIPAEDYRVTLKVEPASG
ncbi:MAG: hypothetical protein ABW171_07510 [Steroidobacter sp.]